MLCCVHFATKALCNIYRNISSSFSRQILSQTLTTNILPIFPKNKLPQEFRQILNPLLCCIGSTANWGLSKLFNSINKAFNTGFQLQQVNCEQNDIYNKKEWIKYRGWIVQTNKYNLYIYVNFEIMFYLLIHSFPAGVCLPTGSIRSSESIMKYFIPNNISKKS